MAALQSMTKGSPVFYALSWIAVFGLLALWSLGAWALNAVAVWSAANAGALAGKAGALETLNLPAWLAPWMPEQALPAVKSLAAALIPMVDSLLAFAPSLAGGLTLAIWLLWGLGTLGLLVLGVIAHALIAMLRRSDPAAPAGLREASAVHR
jgi:hypothetical protein